MDPVLHAARSFLAEADAFWRKHPGRVQPLVGSASDRAEMAKALRLGEHAPDNFRPLFLYEAAFQETSAYLRGLLEAIAHDYEAVRAGIGEEGVEIPAYVLNPLDVGPVGRAAIALEAAAMLLGERFDGVTLALLPAQVADEKAWMEVVREIAALPLSLRVRVAVHAPPGGALDDVLLAPGARFSIDVPSLLDFLSGLGSGSAGPGAGESEPTAPAPGEPAAPTREAAVRELRALLLKAAACTEAGEHTAAIGPYEQAAALCAAEGIADEEANVRMALGGAYMAARVPELAVESYCKAAGLAAALGSWALSSVAWLGAGGVYLALGKNGAAATAYQAAADAATEGEVVALRDEAQSLRGACLERLGRTHERAPAESEAARS